MKHFLSIDTKIHVFDIPPGAEPQYITRFGHNPHFVNTD